MRHVGLSYRPPCPAHVPYQAPTKTGVTSAVEVDIFNSSHVLRRPQIGGEDTSGIAAILRAMITRAKDAEPKKNTKSQVQAQTSTEGGEVGNRVWHVRSSGGRADEALHAKHCSITSDTWNAREYSCPVEPPLLEGRGSPKRERIDRLEILTCGENPLPIQYGTHSSEDSASAPSTIRSEWQD